MAVEAGSAAQTKEALAGSWGAGVAPWAVAREAATEEVVSVDNAIG